MMQRRRLGRDLEVSAVTIGALGRGVAEAARERELVYALQHAFDRGINAIDTAPIYGCGWSERVVGRAIRGRRDDVVVMTKVGVRFDGAVGRPMYVVPDARGKGRLLRANGRPESIRAEVEASLSRLGIAHLDLVQIHVPDPDTPLADTLGALVELRARGSIRAIGVSNFPAAMIDEAARILGDVGLTSVQSEYNPLSRDVEDEILPAAERAGAGFLAYSPLARGLLARALTVAPRPGDDRELVPDFAAENRAKIDRAIATAIEPIRRRRGVTTAQIVLAWVLGHPSVTSAIAGVSNRAQADENAHVLALPPLSVEERAQITRIFDAVEIDPNLRLGARERLARLAHRVVRRAFQGLGHHPA
jgi:aryl-alcohol dehydrogenase-like predicted oxidoreductase